MQEYLVSVQRAYLRNSVFPCRKMCFSEQCISPQNNVFTLRRMCLLAEECVYLQNSVFTFKKRVFTVRTQTLLNPQIHKQTFSPTVLSRGSWCPEQCFWIPTIILKYLKTLSELSVCDYKSHGDWRFMNRIAGSSIAQSVQCVDCGLQDPEIAVKFPLRASYFSPCEATKPVLVCLFLARQPPVGLLIHEVSRSHTTTHHNRYDSSGRVIGSSQRPPPDNTQHSQQTDLHAVGGIRTHNLSRRAAADLRLRPRGHWDRQARSAADRRS